MKILSAIVLALLIFLFSTGTVAAVECNPPLTKDWVVDASCSFIHDALVMGNVLVRNGVVMTIEDGATLRMDLVNKNLTVENGGGVKIENMGKIESLEDDGEAPTPNPMTFASVPVSGGNPWGSITMTATEATDEIPGGIEYLFEETTDMTWIAFDWSSEREKSLMPGYFMPNEEYCFRVKARDRFGNETEWSEIECVTKTGCGATPMYKNGEVTASALDIQTGKSLLPLLPTLLILGFWRITRRNEK